MNNFNLVWIVVDSVRSFRTNADDRDRLDVMDKFGAESIEFQNAYTSAPSSILSAGAMFTGMPSCFVARHFDNWVFDPRYMLSLQDLLAGKGYTNYAIHNSKEDRETMRDLIHPIAHRFFPKGVSHGDWWTNTQVNQILEQVLITGPQSPSFIMLWYDCRNDPLTSNTVERALDTLKEFGLYEKSVIVMCSDHGYPDPNSGLNSATMKNIGHDMIITEDNVKIPLFIKYPGCSTKQIYEHVGTIDLYPTILRLLDIEHNDRRLSYVQGLDLTPLIEGRAHSEFDERLIRIDTRLTMAPGRVSALRSKQYKYVLYHDKQVEELYDMFDDPMEMNDLSNNSASEIVNMISMFRKSFDEMQTELNRFHLEELEIAFQKNTRALGTKKVRRILVLTYAPFEFLSIIVRVLSRRYPAVVIDLACMSKSPIDPRMKTLFDAVNGLVFGLQQRNAKKRMYDISLIVTEKCTIGFEDPEALRVAKQHGKRILMADYNMQFYDRRISRIAWPFRRMLRNWVFYKQEPILIVNDLITWGWIGLRHFVLRKRWLTADAEKTKKMRDRALRTGKKGAERHC